MRRGYIRWGVAKSKEVRRTSKESEVWSGTDEVVPDGIPVGGVSEMTKGE